MFNRILLFTLASFCFLFLLSCQKTEFFDEIIFDNSLLDKINIIALNREINISYQATLNEPFIDHVMIISPTKRILLWLESNIINFGTENKLVIDRFIPGVELHSIFNPASLAQVAMILFQSPPGTETDITF